MGRHIVEDPFVSISHGQEAPQVGAMDQIRYLRPGSVKPNAQLPKLRYLW